MALAAPSAALAGPTVTVRIEGTSDTLVARTAVTTNATDVVKDGTHACSGLSAGGALEQATSGVWSGPWYDAFSDYGLETVKGEFHSLVPPNTVYWGFFLNGYSAPSGICSTTLTQGDQVVFAAVDAAASGGLLELSGVPATVAPGVPFVVTVKRLATTFGGPPDYLATNSADPAKDVTVKAGAVSATTGADGKATLTLTDRGTTPVRASNAVDVRSASEPACVTDGADGYCGTKTPAGTTIEPAPAAAVAADRVAAIGSLASIGEQQHFARAKAPRELRGSVDGEASGIKEVRLRLTRRTGKRCERFDGARERWVTASRCGAVNGTFFSIGDRSPWSYLLPQALTKGRYVLDTQVVDRAGNVTRGSTRGKPGAARNQVVFFVD